MTKRIREKYVRYIIIVCSKLEFKHRYVRSCCAVKIVKYQASEIAIGYYGIKAIINKRTAQFFRVAQEELLSRRGIGDHPRVS